MDAYRLGGGLDEMEDLDLDVSLPDSVVVVEWGEGKVETSRTTGCTWASTAPSETPSTRCGT